MDTGSLIDIIDEGIRNSDAFEHIQEGVDTNLEGLMQNALAAHGAVEHQFQQFGEVRADVLTVRRPLPI